MVGITDLGDHEYLCYHAQYDHQEGNSTLAMIFKETYDEAHSIKNQFDYEGQLAKVVSGMPQEFSEFLVMHQEIHDRVAHQQL